jgi:hypothetical protein
MSPRLSFLAVACASVLAVGCASTTPGGPDASGSVQSSAAPSSLQGKRAAEFHPADVEVVAAQFGVFGADQSGRRTLFETDKFPALVAAPYGWFIVFKTDKPTVVWREEFELPVAPPTWGPGEALGIFQVSPDRKTAVTERIIPTKLGFIANEWRYASGDPVGAHKMRVYIDGQLIREFSFDIEKMPDDGMHRRNPHRGESAPGSST